MVIKYEDVLVLITTLVDEKGLQVTFKESLKGGLIAGACTVAGGVIGGPPGLFGGSAVGGLLAYGLANGKFKPASKVILEDMSAEKRKELADKITSIVSNLDAVDAIELVALVQGSDLLKAQVVSEIVTYLTHNMNMITQEKSS